MRRWAHVQLPVKNDAEYLPLDAAVNGATIIRVVVAPFFFVWWRIDLNLVGEKGLLRTHLLHVKELLVFVAGRAF